MLSPFPGMDPYIENQKWEDFHSRFVTAIGDALVQAVRPKYIVEVEKRVYLEGNDPLRPSQAIIADAAVFQNHYAMAEATSQGDGAVATLPEMYVKPKICTTTYFEEHREAFLTIRKGGVRDVVTVIELLSPTNNQQETDGRKIYVDKLVALLKTQAHLVELDLLRGGQRTSVLDPPEGDYFAMVSRAGRRPLAEVYGWPLHHRLPIIPIPLAGDDPDVALDLQQVFNGVYDRAGYDYSLDYDAKVVPELPAANITPPIIS